MFSNLKTAFQNITSKDKNENEYEGEDIQAIIIVMVLPPRECFSSRVSFESL